MRSTDNFNQTDFFEIDRRVLATEKDISVIVSNINDLRTTMREEQADVKDAIKALAISQSNQATSLAKIESGISTLAKALTFGIPLLGSIFAAFWTYNINIIDKIQTNQETSIQQGK